MSTPNVIETPEGIEVLSAGAEGEEIVGRTPLQLFWLRFMEDKVALVSAVVIVLIALIAIFAHQIIELVGAHPPNAQYPNYLNQTNGLPTGPNGAHHMYFGVDGVGEDVFSRVLYGARVSLEVALIATFFSVLIGVVLGLLAGFYRGWVDTAIARFIDIMLAFPVLLLALGIAAACNLGNGCLGGLIKPGIQTVIVTITIVNWTYIGRIIRGQTLSLREKEFVEAARASGAKDSTILFRELLPNLVAPIIVYSTLIIPSNILFEAALSYLGVGINPPNASWGQMISDSSQIYYVAWWYFAFPGAALLITVLAFNLLGDGVRDALDPRGTQ
ncbi:MAG: ABC transporter permease [Gaiellaceae bacterium]